MASKSKTVNRTSKTKSASSGKGASRPGSGKKKGSVKKEPDLRIRSNIGILLIASGILLGIYMAFSSADSQILGEVAATVPFGLFGMAAWTIPFLLITAGILMIHGAKNDRLAGTEWFVALGALAIIALMQTISGADYDSTTFMEYLKSAWDNGTASRLGGGFVGGVICYPVQKLGGTILAYVLFIALISICVVSITGFSLSGITSRIAEKISADPEIQDQEDGYWDDEFPDDNNYHAQKPLYKFDIEDPDQQNKSSSRTLKKRPGKGQKLPFEIEPPPAPSAQKKKKKTHDLFDDLEPVTDTPFSSADSSSSPKSSPVSASSAKKVQKAEITSFNSFESNALPDQNEPCSLPEKLAFRSIMKESSAVSGIPQARKSQVKAKQTTIEEDLAAVHSSDVQGDYIPPSFDLLESSPSAYSGAGESPNEKAKLLIDTLENFNIECRITDISVGPTLTRFELQPAPGIRVSRITSLSNDIALALAAQRVRIEAPIPGKSAVGIEIPNKNTVTVVLRDIVESKEFQSAKSPITMALGKDISGKIVTADLSKMPHMLIAGQTGSGKSVCINDIIISMVYKSSPQDVKMILIDPKMVELSVFAPLPHLLIPVVTEPKKAAGALRWAVNEMTMRYKKFSEIGARDLARYNSLMEDPSKRFPKLVVVIDELADLMLVAPDDVEDSICRIAQLGRASGIHLIVATQRPSADIITGLIKANIPSRAAFAVSSSIDSRIILDMTGAEKLLGRGDMLFHPNGANKPTRLQAAYVSDEEVERIVHHFAESKTESSYDENVVAVLEHSATGGPSGGAFGEGKQEDDLLGEAVRVVLENGQASISMVQRRLRVGYARAARLIDIMEQKGYVSGFEGSKPRRVLIKKADFEKIFGDGSYSESLQDPLPSSDIPDEEPE